MSTYGSDAIPSKAAAQDLGFTKSMIPEPRAFIMQWSYPDNIVVRKIANRKDSSNCLFKIQQ